MYGWAIGSMFGNVIDPQIIRGPSIGDIQQQTSQEGVPIPIVFGMSPPMAGNVWAAAPPNVVRERQSGKGGPKIETETIYRTYAVEFCEGPIGGFIRAWRNNVKVYDVLDEEFNTPEVDLTILGGGLGPTRNEKFLEKARFFLGTYDQDASTDLEAIYGAGTTAANRGIAYMVIVDEDCTREAGVIPQWQVQVTGNAAPVLTSPTPSGTVAETDEADIGATTSQPSGTFWAVVGTGSDLDGITAQQIMQGLNSNNEPAVGAASAALTDSTPSVNITGLEFATGYTYAAVQQNVNGTSNIVAGTFTTAGIVGTLTAGASGSFVRGYVDDSALGFGLIGSVSPPGITDVNGRHLVAIYTVGGGSPRLEVHLNSGVAVSQNFFQSITIGGNTYFTASASSFTIPPTTLRCRWIWNGPAELLANGNTYGLLIDPT